MWFPSFQEEARQAEVQAAQRAAKDMVLSRKLKEQEEEQKRIREENAKVLALEVAKNKEQETLRLKLEEAERKRKALFQEEHLVEKKIVNEINESIEQKIEVPVHPLQRFLQHVPD